MFGFLVRRLAFAVIILWGISTIVFFLTYLSGDPVNLLLPPDATVEERQEFRELRGYNRPLIVQYADFLAKAARLDFGESIRHRQPATDLVLGRVPATLELMAAGLLISVVVALPLGMLGAIYRGSLIDSASLVTALAGQSLPVFWLGILLILIFSENLHWLPSSGRGGLDHLILPGFTLSALTIAMLTRILRSSMLDVLTSDYVRTARAKGVREVSVIGKHVLRNALIPVITVFGLSAGAMLGGAVITETVFAWPGMGRLAVQAIANRDFAVIQAFVAFVGLGIVLINITLDILYAVIDPRIQLG